MYIFEYLYLDDILYIIKYLYASIFHCPKWDTLHLVPDLTMLKSSDQCFPVPLPLPSSIAAIILLLVLGSQVSTPRLSLGFRALSQTKFFHTFIYLRSFIKTL